MPKTKHFGPSQIFGLATLLFVSLHLTACAMLLLIAATLLDVTRAALQT